MATLYSDQVTRTRAGRNLPANLDAGKCRIAVWDFASLPAGNVGDVLTCFKLYKDERFIFGKEFHSAQGGSATGAYGTYVASADGQSLGAVDLVGRFLAAITFVAAGQNDLGSTQALGIGIGGAAGGVLFDAPGSASPGTGTGQDFWVACTNASSAFATSGRITGYAIVVKD